MTGIVLFSSHSKVLYLCCSSYNFFSAYNFLIYLATAIFSVSITLRFSEKLSSSELYSKFNSSEEKDTYCILSDLQIYIS